MDKPLILISNDDGISSLGIRRLVDAVTGLGTIFVVAPDAPRSGGSAAITCNAILRPKRVKDYNGAQMWSLNGTPADCVKLAVSALLPRRPDIVLAGINHGSNTGNSVVYSGTMGATLEGCMHFIPSIGYSLTDHHPAADGFDACLPLIREITENVLRRGLPEGVCLNVNFPNIPVIKGYKMARACRGEWTEEFAAYNDPIGEPFFLLTGKYVNLEPTATDTDLYALSQGYASVVPTVPDRDYDGDFSLD